jgi:hypothetical protein
VFGLTHTTAGTDGVWGLTRTTVDDQLRLLRQITVTPSVLTATAQDYIQHRMLVTVLSDDNSSEASGISTIQAMAQQAVGAVADG